MSIASVIPSNHSSSVVPFSSHLQSSPASGSFPRSQFFASGGQSIGVSAWFFFLEELFPSFSVCISICLCLSFSLFPHLYFIVSLSPMLLLLLSHFSHVRLYVTHRRQPTRLPRPWGSPGKNTGVGCRFLLQCMKGKVKVKLFSSVLLLATPWTPDFQAPPSMGFSRQEYWSGVPSPSPFHQWLTNKSQLPNQNCFIVVVLSEWLLWQR